MLSTQQDKGMGEITTQIPQSTLPSSTLNKAERPRVNRIK